MAVFAPRILFGRVLSPKYFVRTCALPNHTVRSAADTAQDISPSIKDYFRKSEDLCTKYSQEIDHYISHWAKCNEIYYGKERDMKNYPPLKYRPIHPKVRLGFLPDSWFQAFYPKTGITGPYLLLFGCVLTMINKEIWVVDAHFLEVVSFCIWAPIALKFASPILSNFLYQTLEAIEEYRYYGPLREINRCLNSVVATSDEEIMRISAAASLVKAKEENLFLQLEAAYRDRLRLVHKAIQRRLDYHVERENVRHRFQQQHLANWVADQVVKGITPTQEKETITHCISELRRLATVERAALST